MRQLTACLAAMVFGIGVASAWLAAPEHHGSQQLALASASATHHPHVVELLPLPATSTTIVPPTTVAPKPAVVATPAPATRVVAAGAPAPSPNAAAARSSSTPASRGAEALERINYPWQHLGFSITFDGPNDGLLGKADCNTHRIDIYVRPSQTVQQVAFVTAFELGHAVDCNFMNDQTRADWASIRGFQSGWKWFPGCVCTEDDYGSGDISMVFASWLVPNGGYRWRSNLAPPPSNDEMQRLLPYLQH